MQGSDSESPQNEEQSQSFSWRMLLGTIRRTFPRAKQLQTNLLNEWLGDEGRKSKMLLLDVREVDEHEVSAIEGSLHVKPDDSGLAKVIEQILELKEAASEGLIDVVCYCSVGYRSAKMAQVLQDRFKNDMEVGKNVKVHNLEGSLFKWANEKRPMVDKQGNHTVFCHPYNLIWGKFLDGSLRKWNP